LDDPKEMNMARRKTTKEGKTVRLKATNAETRDDLRRLIPVLVANEADFPHLEPLRVELETIVDELDDVLAQQSTLTAAKQEASRRQQGLIGRGREIAVVLRASVKQRYGKNSEKLAEFNIQPFRGRKTARPEEPTPPSSPVPPSNSPE
jgi:hypothetical protein